MQLQGGQISAARAHVSAINDFEGAVISGFAHDSLKFVIRPPKTHEEPMGAIFPA